MKILPEFNFDRFRVSIWPTLWGVFFVFCLIIWGLHLGQRAAELNHPIKFANFIQSLMPWIAGAMIFINPRVGFVLLVFALSLGPNETLGRINETRKLEIRLEDYLIPFLYFIWVSRMWIKGRMRLIRIPLTGPLVFLTLSLTFSTMIGVLMTWAEPVAATFYWLKQLEYFGLFFLAVNMIETDNDRESLIYAFIFASVVVSVWAIFQGVTGFVLSTGRTGGRAAMPFDTEPATLGEYYIILIPLLLFTLFPRKNFFRTLFNSLLVIIAFLGLFFSLSRGSQVGLLLALPILLFIFVKETRSSIVLGGAMIGFFVFSPNTFISFSKAFVDISLGLQILFISLFAVGVILALIFAKRHRLPIAMLATALVIFSFNPKFISRLGSVTEEVASTGTVATFEAGEIVQLTKNQDTGEASTIEEGEYHSFANRSTDLWPSVIEAISKNPIFGRGLTSIRVADNYYMRITAEAGVIGLSFFLWLIFRLYRNLFQTIKTAPAGSQLRNLAMGLLITLTGLLIASLTDDAFIPVKVMMHFWLLTGIFYSAYLRQESAPRGLNGGR